MAGSLDRAVSAELQMGVFQFWAAVNQLLNAPAAEVALEFGPTIARLRRLRDSRQRQRHAG